MLRKTIINFCIIIIAAIPVAAAPSKKPLPPVSVTISPSQPGITQYSIHPGDQVDLTVVARSLMDADRFNIQINVSEGVKAISGDTKWSGPVKKNQEIMLHLTVQVPAKSTGSVSARAGFSGNGSSFSAEAHFEIGFDKTRKSMEKPDIKKDSKGRRIREYR